MNEKSISVVDESKHPVHTVVFLAWPIFLEQLLVSLVQAVDTAMVGSLGKIATASVAINSSPNNLINGVLMAMGIGFTSLIARSIGANENERARRLIKQAVMVVFYIGIPLSVLYFFLAGDIPRWLGGEDEILTMARQYNKIIAVSLAFRGMTTMLTAIYRGYGDSRTPMVTNVLVNCLNVVGNYLCIYPTREITVFGEAFTMIGLGWGVAGAAFSTSVSNILGGLILLVLCFTKKSEMQISFTSGFKTDRQEMRNVFRISFPAMLERFAMQGSFIMMTYTVASLGTAAIAANNLSGTIESLSFMPGFAFGMAMTTLFGQALGARRPDLARLYVINTIKLGSMVMAFTSLFLFFGSGTVIRLFTPDADVIEMGSTLLKILAVIQIPQMITMVFSGSLRGAGDSKSSFIIVLISMWGVRVLGSIICVRVLHLGLFAVCVCTCVDNVVRCCLFYLRYRQGKWKTVNANT